MLLPSPEAAQNRRDLRPFQFYLLILKVFAKFRLAFCFTLIFVNFLSSYSNCGKTSVRTKFVPTYATSVDSFIFVDTRKSPICLVLHSDFRQLFVILLKLW